MNEKIGMYTEDEILEHLTEGEGRSFLGRSMYDAIFDKIHALKTKNEQLQQENKKYKEVIDKAIEYMKDFIFEPLLTNEDRKLIMYNDNLRNFEKILKEVE